MTLMETAGGFKISLKSLVSIIIISFSFLSFFCFLLLLSFCVWIFEKKRNWNVKHFGVGVDVMEPTKANRKIQSDQRHKKKTPSGFLFKMA